jgi:hypothetical protein
MIFEILSASASAALLAERSTNFALKSGQNMAYFLPKSAIQREKSQ